MHTKVTLAFCTLLLFAASCSKHSTNNNTPAPLPPPDTTTIAGNLAFVDLSDVQQTIRGFGGSSAWLGALPAVDMATLFGNADSTQLGLTILRVRIDPAGSSQWGNELQNAQSAMALGGIVMASPWSPPAAMKTNDSTKNGGSLDTSSYAAYSLYLASFANYFATNGAPLYALSVQNEPEIATWYESCVWTPDNLLNFVKNYAPSIGTTKLMASESFHFDPAYTDPILNDPVAASHLGIVAGHIYGSGLFPYPLAASEGKELWMTEHMDTSTSWEGALMTAVEINQCLASCSFNVYNYWWLKKSWGLIDTTGAITKRGYAMAQFAKYVRPGYLRVTSTISPENNVFVSSYKKGDTVVIVAINIGPGKVRQPFTVTGGTTPASFVPHISTAFTNLQTMDTITATGGKFTYLLLPLSITTFVSF